MDNNTDELHVLSLCSGGGGLDIGVELALERTRVVCGVEWEAFALEVLAARMEEKQMAAAALWSDLRTFDGKRWRGLIDILTAGYPCQPFSLAGKRRGSEDPRHLWPHVCRVVGEVEPSICYFENVSGHLSLGFGEVVGDLEALGYAVAAGLFTAEEVGSSHKRERLFILGVANSQRAERGTSDPGGRALERTHDGVQSERAEDTGGFGLGNATLAHTDNARLERRRESERQRTDELSTRKGRSTVERPFPPGPDELGAWRLVLGHDPSLAPAQSKVRLLADGLAVDRTRWLKVFGNGVVPLQAAYAFCSLWSALRFR